MGPKNPPTLLQNFVFPYTFLSEKHSSEAMINLALGTIIFHSARIILISQILHLTKNAKWRFPPLRYTIPKQVLLYIPSPDMRGRWSHIPILPYIWEKPDARSHQAFSYPWSCNRSRSCRRIPGVTKGSHSWQQVFKSGFTKTLQKGYRMSAKTLAKGAGYLFVSSLSTGFLVENTMQSVMEEVIW